MKQHTNLEGQWESPRNTTWCKGEAKRKPIRYGEARNAIRHLDNDKFASTPHLARLSLPNTSGSSIHASPQTSNNTSDHHLGNAETACLDNCANSNDCAAKQDDFWSAEDITRPDG